MGGGVRTHPSHPTWLRACQTNATILFPKSQSFDKKSIGNGVLFSKTRPGTGTEILRNVFVNFTLDVFRNLWAWSCRLLSCDLDDQASFGYNNENAFDWSIWYACVSLSQYTGWSVVEFTRSTTVRQRTDSNLNTFIGLIGIRLSWILQHLRWKLKRNARLSKLEKQIKLQIWQCKTKQKARGTNNHDIWSWL